MDRKIYAVGLGPGDYEMMTLKAKRVLEEADVIFLNGGKVFNGFEEVKKLLDNIGCGDKLTFIEMPEKNYRDNREEHIKYFVGETVKVFETGKKTAYVTMGDLSVYSSFPDIYEELKAYDIELEAVAGIPSFLAPSALSGQAIAEFRERAVIMPSPADFRDMENILKDFRTVLIMKTSDNGKVIKEYLEHNNPSSAVAVFYAYTEKQKIYDLKKEFPPSDIDFYMSVTMIKS